MLLGLLSCLLCCLPSSVLSSLLAGLLGRLLSSQLGSLLGGLLRFELRLLLLQQQLPQGHCRDGLWHNVCMQKVVSCMCSFRKGTTYGCQRTS